MGPVRTVSGSCCSFCCCRYIIIVVVTGSGPGHHPRGLARCGWVAGNKAGVPRDHRVGNECRALDPFTIIGEDPPGVVPQRRRRISEQKDARSAVAVGSRGGEDHHSVSPQQRAERIIYPGCFAPVRRPLLRCRSLLPASRDCYGKGGRILDQNGGPVDIEVRVARIPVAFFPGHHPEEAEPLDRKLRLIVNSNIKLLSIECAFAGARAPSQR
ncbi:unnamed protein product [Pseudo-nitzschia multistriata]|uniref:Uncharacterized protein n=1 Tax=Pseudo-nitzschia multistriata TaxID=183589 RepID=A0A448ZC21_9STRA|nr:unnamed protein product [Pseudo-nitzschia multistriata]